MIYFGQSILNFFHSLKPPANLPEGLEILWPYNKPEVQRFMQEFYQKYFNDSNKRIFLVGINPGRFGAGVTGLGFTDPNRLKDECGIEHALDPGREVSSVFVYRMINAFGTVKDFYSRFYFTALSPVGFIKDGKNINYYDVKGLNLQLDDWMLKSMQQQIDAGAETAIAFSMGQGANFKYFEQFNNRHKLFTKISPLPHPRWIMQYRYQKIDEYIDLYLNTLNPLAYPANL